MAKILWLNTPAFSTKQRRMVDRYLESEGIRAVDVFYVPLRAKIENPIEKRGKNKIVYNRASVKTFERVLDLYIAKMQPSIIVMNDPIVLSFMLRQDINSLQMHRGSVYHWKGTPVLVIDDVLKVMKVTEYPWVFKQDLKKLNRWLNGNQRVQPRFEYTVCSVRDELRSALDHLSNSFIIADDIETAGGHITCVGFCGLHDDGSIHSFVIPLIDPLKPDGCYWDDPEDEIYAWEIIKKVHRTDAYKVFQNGLYDCAWYVRHRTCPKNYLFDSMYMFDCIWTEAPKKLWFIASIFLDYCKYWKDESKGEGKDKDKQLRMPNTKLGMEMYWRYNAQDVYNSLLCVLYMTLIMTNSGQKWTLNNYKKKIRQQLGPAFAMSMRGMKLNKYRQACKVEKWEEEYEKSLAELKIMTDDPEYNPNSPDQNASLIYDVLGASPVKLKGRNASKLPERTTNETILRIIATRHPIFSIYINKIWDTKKPKNNISKYGKPLGFNGRFHYSLSCILETDRYRSGNHAYWIGTNAQNIPKESRDMFTADSGYVLWEVDYSQSDLYFVAFQCEDTKLMEVVLNDKDTHCIHAAYFFKAEYDRVLAAHKVESDWTDHPTKGIRQNTKRITHGASYQMAAFTLFITMGREAAVETCKSLGHKNVSEWSDSQIVQVLERLLEAYFARYSGLKQWQKDSVEECARNGNLVDNGFGRIRLFFGDIRNNNEIQRQLSSYYGQGGTAGNINRTLDEVYWNSGLEKEGLMLLMQDHDSIIFQTPKDKMYLGEKFLTIMREPVTIKGRTFNIPVDSKVGLSWGKAMIPYRKGITYEEIEAADKAWDKKTYNYDPNAKPIVVAAQ